MKNTLSSLFVVLLCLFAGCSERRESGKPLAAGFEYGAAGLNTPAKQQPFFVLYTDGTLIFRGQGVGKTGYLKLELDDTELTEIANRMTEVLKDPGFRDRYTLPSEGEQAQKGAGNSAYVFFDAKGTVTVCLDRLPAIDIASLRTAATQPDFSGDERITNSLLGYITTLGMLRVSAADPWTLPGGGTPVSFPGQDRWQGLKFAPEQQVEKSDAAR